MKDTLIREINLKIVQKVDNDNIRDLKNCLELYDDEDLRTIYYAITKKEVYDNRRRLINKIYNLLTNKDIIDKFLNTIIDNEYNEIVRILDNNGCLNDDYINFSNYFYLKIFGIVYTYNYNESLYVIIPDEIKDIINSLNIDNYKKKIDGNTNIINLIYSLLNLYGAVPIDLYFDYISTYYKDVSLDNCFDSVIIPYRSYKIGSKMFNDNLYLIKDEDIDFEEENSIYDHIVSKMEDDIFIADFKEISLEELLKYSDMFYYKENKATKTMKSYLKKYIKDKKEINEFVGIIVNIFKEDYYSGIRMLNDVLDDFELKIKSSDMEEFMGYLYNVIDNIPLWGNKGWTNREILLRKNSI